MLTDADKDKMMIGRELAVYGDKPTSSCTGPRNCSVQDTPMKYKTENWEAIGTSIQVIKTKQQVAIASSIAVAKRMVAEHNAIVMLTELHEQKNDDETYKATVIMLLEDFGLRWQK